MLAKLQLYKSLVVPLLEYASPVWNQHTKKDAQKLELVQRHVTKAILEYMQDMDYETRLHVLGLVSLEERRRIKDLVTCYKYINGFTDVDIHYFLPGSLRTRSSHNQKLQIQSCHTNCFMFSFFNRVVPAWNSLPNFVISAQNPVLFRKYYYSLGH